MIHNWNGKWRSNGDSPRAVDLADLSASHLQSINFHKINLCASMRELIVYLRIKLFPRVKSFHRFFSSIGKRFFIAHANVYSGLLAAIQQLCFHASISSSSSDRVCGAPINCFQSWENSFHSLVKNDLFARGDFPQEKKQLAVKRR